jgi:hypothetical protein
MNQNDESRKKMKHYVKVKINRLLKKAQRAFDESNEGWEKVKVMRQPDWDEDEFDAIIQGHCEEIQQYLDDYRRDSGGFDVERTCEANNSITIDISWDIRQDNPFDDLYDGDLGIDTPEDE